MVKLLSSFIIAALGAQQVAAADKAFTSQFCYTQYGPKSVQNVPTSTKVIATTVTATKKTLTFATSTVTPKPFTITTRNTVEQTSTITADAHTDVSTSTETQTITVPTTNVVSETTTVQKYTTTTLGDGTSTVPAAPGFTPIQSQMGYPPAKRAEHHPRDFRFAGPASKHEDEDENLVRRGNAPQNPQDGFKPQGYPKSVDCKQYIKEVKTQTITSQARKTIITRAPRPIVNATATETVTTTSILIPGDVTSTLTETTHAYSTTTILSTSTIIEEVTNTITENIVPTATTYAACKPDNFAKTYNNAFIDLSSSNGLTFEAITVAGPTECCAACQNLPECRAFVSHPNRPDTCWVFIGQGTCPAGGAFGPEYKTRASQYALYNIGNGNCWSWKRK